MARERKAQAKRDAERDGARIPKNCQHTSVRNQWITKTQGHWEKDTCNDCGNVLRLDWVARPDAFPS